MDINRFPLPQYRMRSHTDKHYSTLIEMIIQIRKFNKVIPLIFDTQLFSSGLVLSAIVIICVA